MDSRFAELADRYSQIEVEADSPKHTEVDMEFIELLMFGDKIKTNNNYLYDVENKSHTKFRERIQQTIQNTALSGDTCW